VAITPLNDDGYALANIFSNTNFIMLIIFYLLLNRKTRKSLKMTSLAGQNENMWRPMTSLRYLVIKRLKEKGPMEGLWRLLVIYASKARKRTAC
jgi:hypothetical protein